MIQIESDHWRLWCNPDRGVQWMAAQVNRHGQWHSVVPDCRETGDRTDVPQAGQDPNAPLPAASFHMLPYSNRIRDGRFEFQGKTIQLAHGDKHAIHGALRGLPWQLVSSDTHSFVCSIDSAEHPGLNWPWPITARITHRIDGDSLSCTLSLSNQSKSDMPAGFGWHPYFVRQVNGSEPTLTLPVDGVFPDESGDCLPDGAAIELPEALNFQSARQLDADQHIDCCLSGLNGSCIIDWQKGGIQLRLSASDICRHLILYNPAMPHFAVEPVVNANDAFNLTSQGIEAGMQILAPGETLEATMVIQLITS